MIKKVKKTIPLTYVTNDLNREEIFRAFYKKELLKRNQKEIRDEILIKRKGDKLYVKWKVLTIHLIVGLIKNILLYKMSYFPVACTRSKNKIKVELDLSHYTTKSDLKKATDIDTSNFAKKADLFDLRSKLINKIFKKLAELDGDRLKPVSVALRRLSDIVDNDVVKKFVYDELVKKVDAIDCSKLVKK